ncbi:MAG: DUF72 domain-containing protein [Planctomycetaceae bacterium]|nr:DUF72 domain-containing protein [Planctomycetaceae bacterium]
MAATVYIGCAGWSLRKEHGDLFSNCGSHLERYATRFNAVEINSSFYRSHRLATYDRWAASTPPTFRFAVKLPKQITHLNRLLASTDAIARFASETVGLRAKLGAVLVQLPPSLAFDGDVAAAFFQQLTAAFRCPIVCEPRHASWFEPSAEAVLAEHRIGRVAADPPATPAAAMPLTANGLVYYRWHGSPQVYYSSYDGRALADLSQRLTRSITDSLDAWIIFDNTALGAATLNASELQYQLRGGADGGHIDAAARGARPQPTRSGTPATSIGN